MTTDPFFSNATTFFLVVFRHRSFSKAAHELGVTQSAVSQTIAQLEVQIGLDLFNRTTRPLTPTKEAGVLYTELSKRQTDIKDVLHNLQSSNFLRPFIRIGCVESLLRTIGPRFFKTLLDQNCRITVHCGTSDILYQKLLLDELDVIIATGQFRSSDRLDQRTLFLEPHVILLPEAVAKRRQSWQWEDLQYCGIPLIRYTSNTASGLQTEMVLAQAHLDLPTTFAVDDNLTVFSLVNAGFGWSLTQPLALLGARDFIASCKILQAPHPCPPRELLLARKKSTPLSLMETVGSACHQCIKEDVLPLIRSTMPWTAEELFLNDLCFQRIRPLLMLSSQSNRLEGDSGGRSPHSSRYPIRAVTGCIKQPSSVSTSFLSQSSPSSFLPMFKHPFTSALIF